MHTIRRPRSTVSTLGTVLSALALTLSPAASASPQGNSSSGADPAAGAPRQPEPDGRGHALGSQIRRHEGGPPSGGSTPRLARTTVEGMDVSGHQESVSWQSWWDKGKRFAYVKATEGTGFRSDYFAQQYTGAADVGMIRGAYHFALPNVSTGARQAEFFVDNGGGWSADGRTLPGVIDLEYNPYGETCYGMTPEQLGAWVADFNRVYHARTGRHPVIYTSTSWWNRCVSGDFSDTNPLWVARYNDQPGELPGTWSYWTFWQYTSSPLDQNKFNGPHDQLVRLADGG
ncbi:lysozyme [Salinifilum aidingensis]